MALLWHVSTQPVVTSRDQPCGASFSSSSKMAINAFRAGTWQCQPVSLGNLQKTMENGNI
jgi:hypothetical protein